MTLSRERDEDRYQTHREQFFWFQVIQSYLEFSLASQLYYVLKENAASEQSSRMTAMDNASKNATEMIDKLTLIFNRTSLADKVRLWDVMGSH